MARINTANIHVARITAALQCIEACNIAIRQICREVDSQQSAHSTAQQHSGDPNTGITGYMEWAVLGDGTRPRLPSTRSSTHHRQRSTMDNGRFRSMEQRTCHLTIGQY